MENSLAKRHPELVAEWSVKNLPLTAEDVSYGSNKIYWWKGPCGHEWETSVKARSKGEKCPICANARVVSGVNDLATVRPDLVGQWSERNTMPPSAVTIESHTLVWWKGLCGHEWRSEVRSRAKNDSKCPFCTSHKLLPGFNDLKTRFPEIAKEWSPRNLPLKPDMVTAFANRRVWWKCHTCGNEWYALISTRSGGSECPYCSGITLLPGVNDLKTLYPDLAAEWSEKNGTLTPETTRVKSRKNVWWKCKTCGHVYRAIIASRVRGRQCPVCANRAVLAGFNDLATTDPQLAREWDFERNSMLPSMISRSSCYRVWWRCNQGHHWSMKVADRSIDGKGCIYCEKDFLVSLPTLAAAFYTSKLKLRITFEDDSVIGIPIEIYIPELMLGIDSVSKRTREAKVEQGWKRHLCSANGITLVEISLDKKTDPIRLLSTMKKAFQKKDVFINSDIDEDLNLIRKAFDKLREQKE